LRTVDVTELHERRLRNHAGQFITDDRNVGLDGETGQRIVMVTEHDFRGDNIATSRPTNWASDPDRFAVDFPPAAATMATSGCTS
jgi:hypothetical protein